MRIITIRVRPVLVKGSFTGMIIMITTGVFKIEVGSGQSIGDGQSFEECSFRHIHSFQTRSNCIGHRGREQFFQEMRPENTILKKMQPILIQLLDYPLHTSGHGGKCKCYKKRCTWGRRGEPLAPPSSIEQSGGKAKCGEFEGRDEERKELLLGENGDFGGGRTKEGVEGVVGF